MAKFELKRLLEENTYPGRGIVIGKSSDGKKALFAYFIMGRSENSRNRVFERFDGGMRTKAFDETKVSDPRLIIYNAYLACGNADIVTNGDQTDTIFRFVKEAPADPYAFERALSTRVFEPDAPNFTPRVSGIARYDFAAQTFTYKLSILKSGITPAVCRRFTFDYAPEDGIGHFIHTYVSDGAPIPSFVGEPEEVALPDTAEELADTVWNALNPDNKVSLFVRAVPLDGSAPTEIVCNKNV